MKFNEKAIEEFREYLLLEKNRSIHTADNYVRDLYQFEKFIDYKTFNKVEPFGVSGFIIALKAEGKTTQTTNRKLSTLKTFYKFMKKRGYVVANPTDGVDGGKPEERLPQPVDVEDIDEIYNTIPDTDLRAKVIFEIMYVTGARRFEVAKVQVKDINFNRGQLRIIGKGNKERIVPLTDYLLTIMKKLIIQNGNGQWLFPSKQYPTKCISTRRINEIVAQYVKEANLDGKGITPHKYRHSFCSHLHEGGADLKTIQSLAGHSNANTTNRYTKISTKRNKDEFLKAHPRAQKQA